MKKFFFNLHKLIDYDHDHYFNNFFFVLFDIRLMCIFNFFGIVIKGFLFRILHFSVHFLVQVPNEKLRLYWFLSLTKCEVR